MSSTLHRTARPTCVRAVFLGPATDADRAAVVRAHGQVDAVHDGHDAREAPMEELLDAADVVHVTLRGDAAIVAARAAVRAGRAVVLHHATGHRADDLRGLEAAAVEAGVRVTVPLVRRYYPMVRVARRRVRGGRPGPVQLLRGAVVADAPRPLHVATAYGELGAAWCDLAEFTSGHRVRRLVASQVLAAGDTVPRGDVLPADAVALLFQTDLGAVGSLVLSRLTPGGTGSLSISLDGVEESLTFHESSPEILDVAGLRTTERLQRGMGGEVSRYSTQPAGRPQGYGDCFDAFVADSYAAVRGGEPDGLPVLADLVRAGQLEDAVARSLETSTWVDVTPSTPTEGNSA